MTAYMARRTGHALVVLIAVSLLSFLFLQMAPGGFMSEMRLNPQISAETVAALRAQYGLDQPLWVRYFRWATSVMSGDFGYSFAYNMPAAGLLATRARNTLLLTGTAAVISWAIAIPLGVWAAAHRRRWFDRLFATGTSTLVAMPDLLIALVLLLIAVRTGAFPSGGMASTGASEMSLAGRMRDLALHLALPVAAIVAGTLPVLLRHVRASMIEILDAPFVRAARGHGLPTRWILFRYALRAACHPLLTLLGFSIATLLSASLLVEVVMSWPGLGPMLLEAIFARDVHVVVGGVLLSAVFLLVGNAVADVLLYAADPRIRVGGHE